MQYITDPMFWFAVVVVAVAVNFVWQMVLKQKGKLA